MCEFIECEMPCPKGFHFVAIRPVKKDDFWVNEFGCATQANRDHIPYAFRLVIERDAPRNANGSNLESEPISPSVAKRVHEILKERGFKNYQDEPRPTHDTQMTQER